MKIYYKNNSVTSRLKLIWFCQYRKKYCKTLIQKVAEKTNKRNGICLDYLKINYYISNVSIIIM